MKLRVSTAFAISLLLVTVATTAFAQTGETEQWADWWLGIYGGVNYNMFNGEEPIDTANGAISDAGSGIGIAAGGLVEYNPGGLLGFNLMIGYDGRGIDHDAVAIEPGLGTVDYSTSLSYISIEPNLRVNLGSRFFHLLLGPGIGINVGKGWESTLTDPNGGTTTASGDIQDVSSIYLSGNAGLGYDISLNGPSASTQILLTPFVQYRMGLSDAYEVVEPYQYRLDGIRGGLQLKFGSPPAAPGDVELAEANYDFTVRAPMVIAESRRISETFPMRNYIFFDEGSTAIPARYKKLSPADAAAFREEQLLKPVAQTGGASAEAMRSRRQMEVYYNALNVFGDRMRENPSATLTLIGAASGDATAGKEMAENVKAYLTNTFGIPASRVTTKGAAMPPHKSGSGSSQGEDRKMIAAENHRVEIVADPADLLLPVNIVTLEEEPIGNDVVFTLNSATDVEAWTVDIVDDRGRTTSFGPYSSGGGNVVTRVDAKEIIGDRQEARYTARVTYQLANGGTAEASKEFRLVRADPDEEQTGERFSILFEFDDSKTVQTYDQFLTETVAPQIPNKATVIIHGHTDVIGTDDYNKSLSDRRVDETRKVLTRELTKAGKTVTFDSYGFGEDQRRSPFDNTLPEQRYYNRTVVIEIVPAG